MSSCATCGKLADRVDADLEAGESLPPEVSRLEVLAGSNARRCPTCRALFLYTYDYEYGALGDGWEDATIERVDRDRVVAVLLALPPSSAVNAALAELGVADGEAAITTKLLADLDVPSASYEAVRKLTTAALARSDTSAIERLLHHPRAKVRADTLYLLQTYRGSLVFRAVAAANDPNPGVRDAAAKAAFVDPPRDVGLEPMITACLDDVDEDVRSNAAWTLAVFAEDKRDVSAAAPALEARVADDPSPKVRTTATRALAAIRAEASRTKTVSIWRCPKCGSTDAGPDESRSAYEFTYMRCNGCKSGGLVDSWERDSDWSAEIDVPVHSTELPSHVAPLAPGEGFYETLQAVLPAVSPSPSPPPDPQPAPPAPTSALPPPSPQPPSVAPAIGCSRCFGDDAALAWEALRASGHQSLVQEDRWSMEISSCSCGQCFAVVFTERVDYRGDGDDLTWLALPITPDERNKLARCGKPQVPGVLEGFGDARRFLVRNQVGGSVDAWWRTDGFSLDPSIPTSAEPETEVRDTPIAWILRAEEVAELWALGIPLDAACVPDDQLRDAIASRRVKHACSSSSMGTAETYWAVAEPADGLILICRNGVVMPPGETAQETAFEDRADDRDVHKILWVPFLREQRAAVARAVPQELRPMIVDAYARILADLEERWAKGAKRIERAPFLEWLRTDGPVDAELESWLGAHTKRSVDHLVQGIRARWLTHDVAAAFDAVMNSVERFKGDPELERTTRIELLRCAARAVRTR